LSLWRQSAESSTTALAIEEIARFNEAIDQALEESVNRYSDDVTTFLSVIGHDLQGSLLAIEGSSEMLAKSEVEEETRQGSCGESGDLRGSWATSSRTSSPGPG
jgi:signal transduction histidine kinase